MINQKMVFICAGIFLVLLTSCKNPSDPGENQTTDSRRYVWSVDTLAYPGSLQTLMSKIWGSSATDVYAVGHNERGFGMMYHFDGESWEPVNLPLFKGKPSFTDIVGFAHDDIYAVGDFSFVNPNPPPNFLHSSLVIHYDGSTWNEMKIPAGPRLYAIGGSSPSNLFAGGRNGVMFHYNGTRWQPSLLPSELLDSNPEWEYGPIAIEGNPQTGEVFMLYRTSSLDYYLLKHAGEGWQILKNMHQNTIYADLWMSPWGKLYAAATGDVQVWTGTDWEYVLLEASEAVFSRFQATGIHGTAEDNFFVVGANSLFHYNGVDRFEVMQFPNTSLDRKVWSGDGQVFVLAQDVSSFPMVTLIYHGK